MSSTEHLLRHDALGYVTKPSKKELIVRPTSIKFNRNSHENQDVLLEYQTLSKASAKKAINRDASFIRGSQFRTSTRPAATPATFIQPTADSTDFHPITDPVCPTNGNASTLQSDSVDVYENGIEESTSGVVESANKDTSFHLHVHSEDDSSEGSQSESVKSTPRASGQSTPRPPSPFVNFPQITIQQRTVTSSQSHKSSEVIVKRINVPIETKKEEKEHTYNVLNSPVEAQRRALPISVAKIPVETESRTLPIPVVTNSPVQTQSRTPPIPVAKNPVVVKSPVETQRTLPISVEKNPVVVNSPVETQSRTLPIPVAKKPKQPDTPKRTDSNTVKATSTLTHEFITPMSPSTNQKYKEAMKAMEYIDDLDIETVEDEDEKNKKCKTLPLFGFSKEDDTVDDKRSSTLDNKADPPSLLSSNIFRSGNMTDLSTMVDVDTTDNGGNRSWRGPCLRKRPNIDMDICGTGEQRVTSLFNPELSTESTANIAVTAKLPQRTESTPYSQKFAKKQRPATISAAGFGNHVSLKKAMPYYLLEPFAFVPEEDDPEGIVVAIDIGSSHSGYAYSFFPQPDKIHIMHMLENGYTGVRSNKVPSCILLDSKHNFHSFGYRAREFYYQLSRQETKQWFFVENFKPKISSKKNINSITLVKAANGVSITLLEVYRHMYCFFRERVLSELRVILPDDTALNTRDILWVITFPSNWPVGGIDLIKRAAKETGFQDDKLLFITEASAAASYCSAEILHGSLVGSDWKCEPKILQRLKELRKKRNQKGDCVSITKVKELIIDCGGVTTNLAIQEWDEAGEFKLISQKAISEGSAEVDEAFRQLMNDIFGCDFMESFRTKCPLGYLELFNAFESRKQICSFSRESAPFLNIPLPFSMISHYKIAMADGVDDAIKEFNDPNITWTSQGMIRISRERIAELFCPAINAILRAIGDALTHHPDIDLLLLIGGFSRSPILRHEIVETFSGNRTIIIPPNPDIAILKGAVIRGWNQERVLSIKSRFTYGISVLRRFDPLVHPESKHVTRNDHDWCVDVFDPLLLANQEIGDKVSVKRQFTAGAHQKDLMITVYQSNKELTKFVSDPGVKDVGHVHIDLTQIARSNPDNSAGLPISIKAEFVFLSDGFVQVHTTDLHSQLPLPCSNNLRVDVIMEESQLI